jgi:hypothetical protein
VATAIPISQRDIANRTAICLAPARLPHRAGPCYHPAVITEQMEKQFVFGGASAASAGREAGDHDRVCHQGR